MSKSQNRKAAFLVLAAISLSFIGFAGPVAGAATLDITGLRISPNPGYACENTTISFNVTNNLGAMVDLVDVHVDAKGSAGGMSWQSNITMFADRATSFQSFTWNYPPEGTYDVSITVIGAGQIAQKSGIYTVLPCAPNIHIRSVTVVRSAVAPDAATLTVDVHNDGHAQANNTTVAVQATGPHPDTTRYFLGSTVIPKIAAGDASHPDFMWSPMPASGVYTFTVMTIDETGVLMSEDVSLVIDLQTKPNTVQITGISVDPWAPMQGVAGNVTATLLFRGDWNGQEVAVKAVAAGKSTYILGNRTVLSPDVDDPVRVNFTWPPDLEPDLYTITVSAFGFNPQEITASASKNVSQLPRQKQWLPANFRLELTGLRTSPYPALPGQNSTVTVEIQNTGDADAPPAKLTVTAEGPAFYNLGTRTTPNTSFGTMVRMEFPWPQPVVPGEYVIRAFLEDIGGNQSDLKRTFVLPHVLETTGSFVNGSTVFNYYYYGGAPNGTADHNVTVTVKQTGEGASAGLGMSNPAVAGVTGVAVGGAISAVSVLAYAFASKKGYDYYMAKSALSGAQTNPAFQENKNSGQMPEYQGKGTPAESPLELHERMVHGVHRGEGVDEPQEASLVGGAVPGGAVISSAVSSGIRESPSRPSAGQTSIRESPTLPSTGPASEKKSKVAAIGRVETPLGLEGSRESPTLASTGTLPPRDRPTGQATGKRTFEPSEDDSDDDGVADPLGMAINEKGLPGDKKKKSSSQARTAGGEPTDPDSDDDGLSDAEERKGWDGTVKGSTKVDEGQAASASKKGYDYYQAQSELNSAGKARESPSRPSMGQTTIRESPTLASTRDHATGQATGKRQHGPVSVTDEDGDTGSAAKEVAVRGWDPVKSQGVEESPPLSGTTQPGGASSDRMAINTKGTPGSSKPVKGRLGHEDDPGEPSGPAGMAGDLSRGHQPDRVRESPTLPSTGQTSTREASTPGISEIRESPTKGSLGQTSLRESPTRASTGASVADQPSEIRESPTLPSKGREAGSGLATGRRSYEPAAADLDKDGSPELRAQNNGTTRSNRWDNPKVVEGSSEDLDGDGAPDLAMKEEGGRHTPFQNRVQDYNSSRSNKSSSALDTGAGADSGAGDTEARRRVEVLKSNKQGDPNANRSDSGGGQGGDIASKGWDGTVKGSTGADEAPEETNASNPIPGVGIVVKHNPAPPKTK